MTIYDQVTGVRFLNHLPTPPRCFAVRPPNNTPASLCARDQSIGRESQLSSVNTAVRSVVLQASVRVKSPGSGVRPKVLTIDLPNVFLFVWYGRLSIRASRSGDVDTEEGKHVSCKMRRQLSWYYPIFHWALWLPVSFREVKQGDPEPTDVRHDKDCREVLQPTAELGERWAAARAIYPIRVRVSQELG